MNNYQEFPEKFQNLPSYIQNAMLSPATADINEAIGEKYKLSDEQLEKLIGIIVGTIFKEIPLEKLAIAIQQEIGLDAQISKQLALDVAVKRLLPIKNYFPEIEMLIQNLGGKIPEIPPSQPRPDNSNVVDLRNQ